MVGGRKIILQNAYAQYSVQIQKKAYIINKTN